MGTVFWFTVKQNTKGKGFVFATFLFPVILCLGCILACVIMAMNKGSEENKSVIKTVYVTNHTELSYLDFSEFGKFAGEEYGNIQFVTGEKKDIKAGKKERYALNAELTENDKEYAVRVNLPEWSEISYGEAVEFNGYLTGYVENLRTIDLVRRSKGENVKETDIMTALMPVHVEHNIAGEENAEGAGLGAELMKMLLPMLIIFMLYMMVLLYGQSVGKLIISEKVSKLMETMLITVKPYQLIAGKILAIVSIAVLQILLWIAGLSLGLFLGHFAAKQISPDYTNLIFEAAALVKELGSGMAFSAPAILLSVLAMIFGFIFYCVLAGLFAAPAAKAEELASSYGIFQMLAVIAFLAAYMLPLQGIDSSAVQVLLYVLPFTSSFMLSGDILTGNIGLAAGSGYLALLILLTAGLAVYAGRLYKNQVFYQGASGKWIQRFIK